MGGQFEIEVEISSAAGAGLQVALALEPQATAGLDPGRDAHLHLFLIDRQGALAAPEGVGVAELQGGFGIEVDSAASAPTRKTAPREAAPGEAGTEAAGKASSRPREASARRPAGATKAAQQVVDEVVEIAIAAEINVYTGRSPARTAAHLAPILAKLLIFAPFIRIGEHLIGLADLLETGFSRGVARIDIGVKLASQLAEGALDGVGIGTPLNPQHLEIVPISVCAHRGGAGEQAGRGIKAHPWPFHCPWRWSGCGPPVGAEGRTVLDP